MKLRRSKEKILMAVWAVMVFCGLAAGIGIFVANESMTWATGDGKPRKYASEWDWNTESVRWFEGGQEGPATANGRGQTSIKYWQPVEQQYGLGYINFSPQARGIDHVCSSVVFTATAGGSKVNLNLNPDDDEVTYHLPYISYKKPNEIDSYHKEHICYFRANGNKGTRNDTNFVDHIGGAQSIGKRYDVREYVSAAYGKGKSNDGGGDNCGYIRVRGVNNSTWNNPIGTPDQPINANRPYASVSRQCKGVTILEFHFYPYQYLKTLDENLKFIKLTYNRIYHYNNWESYCARYATGSYTDKNGTHYYTYCAETKYKYFDRTSSFPPEYYNVYAGRNVPTTFNDICYSGLYQGGPSHNFSTEGVMRRCFTPEFKERYIPKINQIRGLNPSSLASQLSSGRMYLSNDVYNEYLKSIEVSFNGFMAMDDIDGQNEGYTPLKGVNRIFLERNTRISQKNIPSGFEPQNWLNLYCKSANRLFCNKEWYKYSKGKNSTPENPATSIYMQYASTADNPLTLAYYTNGHVSGITSEGVPVLYVVEDIEGYSESAGGAIKELKEKLATYKKEFKEIYGQSLATTIDILKGKVANPLTGKKEAVIPDDPIINENTVLIYFEAAKKSYYDPYTINSTIFSFRPTAEELPWYRDVALRDYIEPRVEDEPNDPKKRNRIIGIDSGNMYQTKNIAVYFTKISRLVEDYQNTCFSNNKSIKTE